jgi:hypothetical protein
MPKLVCNVSKDSWTPEQAVSYIFLIVATKSSGLRSTPGYYKLC